MIAVEPAADVALVAHVGYEVEAIGPFLDATEAAAGERRVAVLADRSPGAIADPLWCWSTARRRPLPCLPDLLEPLAARGRHAKLVRADRQARRPPIAPPARASSGVYPSRETAQWEDCSRASSTVRMTSTVAFG